jgi:hypothetical protein
VARPKCSERYMGGDRGYFKAGAACERRKGFLR